MPKNVNACHEEVARKPTDEYLKINTKERVKAILSLGKPHRRLENETKLIQSPVRRPQRSNQIY